MAAHPEVLQLLLPAGPVSGPTVQVAARRAARWGAAGWAEVSGAGAAVSAFESVSGSGVLCGAHVSVADVQAGMLSVLC